MALQNDLNKTQNYLDTIEKRFLNDIKKNYRDALKNIRADIERLYDKYAEEGILTLAEMTKFDRLTKLERRITDIMRPAIRKNDRLLDKVKKVNYESSFYRHQWVISQDAGASIAWGMLNKEAVEEAIKLPLDRIAKKKLRQNTIPRIQAAISQGLIQGQHYTGMAKGIEKAIEGTYNDAARIARTEAGRAQTKGSQAAYADARKKGIELGERWDATLDARTRPAHGRMDGKEAQEKNGELQFYSPNVGWIKGPKQSGVPGFDINCRCRVNPVVEGYPPKVRRARDEGIIPYQTFSTWAKERGLNIRKYGQRYEL